jgi:hypothetical protein
VRRRLATLTVPVITVAMLNGAAFSTAAAARTVKTFAIRNGVTWGQADCSAHERIAVASDPPVDEAGHPPLLGREVQISRHR